MKKCFKWNKNDQYATPTNIYDFYINKMGYTDFNPLKVDYVDSLKLEFNCDLYCNPPYSNIEPFVDYMINHYKKGYNVVMLLPVRTGTKWFRKIVKENCEIDFFTQRLKFNDYQSAPFDCMLVWFNKDIEKKMCFIDRNLKIIDEI